MFDPILAIIRYQYNNITVSRLDRARKTYFYFGNYPGGENLPNEYIVVTYWGHDSSLDGKLMFERNGLVTLLPGSFSKQIGKVGKLVLRTTGNPVETAGKEHKNFNSVSVSNLIEQEKQRNKASGSKVLVLYN